MRAGAHALCLLAAPLNAQVLQALAERPVALGDLRRAVGLPPQTTMRMHLRNLEEAGILSRRQEREFPGPVEYELAGPGRELLGVAKTLEGWLQRAPHGPLELGGSAAKSSTKALAEGWSFAIVRALASRPLALTELSRLISGLSYPSLERRLGAMRMAGLIERCAGGGRGRPYEVTDWLRLAVGPLVAAARWERKHLADRTPPVRRIDIEAAFLLLLPRVPLSGEASGACRLAVDTSDGAQHRQAGVIVRVDRGSVASCVTRLDDPVEASVTGSLAAWVHAVRRDDSGRLELGGDRELAAAFAAGLHRVFLQREP